MWPQPRNWTPRPRLCFVLIPHIGIEGAAAATSTALIVESLCLYYVAKRKLGFHVFLLGNKKDAI